MESKKINQLATSVNPQTSDLTIIGDPVTGVSKKITLLQIANLFATTGTVSSVAVTETGDALTITGSPITSAGTINIGFAGAANQYVRGDGALADFPTSTGGGSSVSYYLNSSVSQGTIGGVAYRELSKEPIIGAGTDITISANGYVASYITDANDPALLEVPGGNFNCELYFSVNSDAHNPYVYAELYKYDGTTFTLLGSSVAVPEYLTNGTTISPYYFAIPVPTSALTITDRLAIRIYANVDTRTVTLHTENSHLCQVVTTFSKGLTALNNLTKQVQYLATGTSGTNFAIVSSGDTHTFNLPVASATNTGKLSSSDWSTFNNKVPYTGATGSVDLGAYSLSADTLNGVGIFSVGSGTQSGFIGIKQGTTFIGNISGYNSINANATKFILTSDVGSTNYKSASFQLGSLTNNTERTYTLPDLSGTLALLEGTQTFSGAKTFSNLVTIETASYLTSRLKLNNTATGGNSWSLSSGNQNNSTNNGLFTIINETLNKNTFVLGPTGKLDIGADLGTINPAFALSIYDTNPVLRVYDLAGNASSLNLQATNSSAFISAAYGTTAIPLVLRTGNTDRLTIAANGAMTLSSNVTTTGSQFVQNGFYLTNSNGGATAGYTNMWGADDGIFFGLRNLTGGAKFVFQSATSYNYTFPAATGTLALTSDLSAYLPLTGGTLTGALDGTSATFSGLMTGGGTIRATGATGGLSTGSGVEIRNNSGTGEVFVYNRSTSAYLPMRIDGSTLSLNTITSGAITLGGALSGTSASFSSSVTAANTGFGNSGGFIINYLAGYVASRSWRLANDIDTFGDFSIQQSTTQTGSTYANKLYFNATGAATFSSSVSARSGLTGTITAITTNDASGFGVGLGYVSGSYGYVTSQSASSPLVLAIDGGEKMRITTSGNVGIGTSSPAVTLHALGKIRSQDSRGGSFAAVEIYGGDSSFNPYISVDQNNPLTFITGGSERMRITGGGNVGIGTASTSAPLTVRELGVAGAPIFSFVGNSSNGNWMRGYWFKSDGTTGIAQLTVQDGDAMYIGTVTSIPFIIQTASTERMRITSGGYLKASNTGTYLSATSTNHELVNSVGGNYAAQFSNTNSTSPFGIQVYYPNTLNNTSNRFIDCEDNTALRFSARSNGGLANFQANDVNLSDERTKKDIIPLESYWDKFKAIEIVKFKYKDQTHDDFNIGVIAQQVEAVAPEFVDVDGWDTKPKFDDDGNEIVSDDEPLKSIYTADLHHATIKVLQECMAKIEEQQQQIEELKQLILNK